MGLLSEAEIKFLKGELEPNPGYRRVLLHRIKKKKQQMEEELALINEFIKKHRPLQNAGAGL